MVNCTNKEKMKTLKKTDKFELVCAPSPEGTPDENKGYCVILLSDKKEDEEGSDWYDHSTAQYLLSLSDEDFNFVCRTEIFI